MWSRKQVGLLLIFIIIGLLVRLFFVHRFVMGDIMAHAEWGELYWQIGSKNFYNFDGWYYTFPTQPPLINLLFAFSYWLYERRYYLAELHNLIKIPPAFVIVYFYEHGYILLLKLWGIIGDVLLSLIAYWSVYKLKDQKSAWIAFLFILFNPVTIFISSVWGQTGSLVAVFGLLSFIYIAKKQLKLSIPFLFISLYLKPTWVVLVPLYIFILLKQKVKIVDLIVGVFVAVLLFFVSTQFFVENNFVTFMNEIVVNNMLPSAKGGARTSISAFNFYTIFQRIDYVLTNQGVFFLTWEYLGYLIYFLINCLTFFYFSRNKENNLLKIFVCIFAISMGSYLFMTNMLERYFFAAFVPMIILMFSNKKAYGYIGLINLVLFLNLYWAFFRRSVESIDYLFTANNFIFLRILSLSIVLSYMIILKLLDFKSTNSKSN